MIHLFVTRPLKVLVMSANESSRFSVLRHRVVLHCSFVLCFPTTYVEDRGGVSFPLESICVLSFSEGNRSDR
jgi:hypothetical protein